MSLTYTYCRGSRLFYIHAKGNRAFRVFNFGKFRTEDEAIAKLLTLTNLHTRALKRRQ